MLHEALLRGEAMLELAKKERGDDGDCSESSFVVAVEAELEDEIGLESGVWDAKIP